MAGRYGAWQVVLAVAFGTAGIAGAALPYSADSVARGRALYLANCTQCHGIDGKAQVDVIADATDLTEPALYRSGTSDEDIIRAIRDGAAGTMPPWGAVFPNPNDIDHLKNYIKSLWPADRRPTGP